MVVVGVLVVVLVVMVVVVVVVVVLLLLRASRIAAWCSRTSVRMGRLEHAKFTRVISMVLSQSFPATLFMIL